MKRINDSRLYFWFASSALALGLITGAISSYSYFFVEPEVRELLNKDRDYHKNYSAAYVILRDPQIFALYEHFDAEGAAVKNSLRYFDSRISSGAEFDRQDKKYLEVLMDRREKGSLLGMKSMFFLFIISLLGWAAFAFEKVSRRRDRA